MEKKLDQVIEHIIDIKTEQARQGEQIDRNTQDLSAHIEGVIQNRTRIEVLEKILQFLKGAVKAFAIICSLIVASASLAAAIVNFL